MRGCRARPVSPERRSDTEKKRKSGVFGGNMLDIILVEDNPDHRLIIKDRLNTLFMQCSVSVFENAGSCLEHIDNNHSTPDMIISDLFLEDKMDGLDLFRELQKRRIPSQFILISSNGKELIDRKGVLRSGDLYFSKDQFLKGNLDFLRDMIRSRRVLG
jgi:CheY-like chemotaxis protein